MARAAVTRRDDRARAGGLRWRFWLVTVAALVALATTLSLGRWQLSRAAQKEALLAQAQAQQSRAVLDQQAFLALPHAASAVHRPVRLRGLWLPEQTIYLDNRQMDELVGFYVLTPLALAGSDQVVMVQRGWVQRNFVDRTQLQPVQTPAGLVEVSGVLAPPPSHTFELGTASSDQQQGGAGTSAIRQNLNLGEFRIETALPLRTDITVQQTGPASEGLKRDWPAVAVGTQTNYGYAFQWFGLSVLIVLLYVWYQFIAPRRRARRN